MITKEDLKICSASRDHYYTIYECYLAKKFLMQVSNEVTHYGNTEEFQRFESSLKDSFLYKVYGEIKKRFYDAYMNGYFTHRSFEDRDNYEKAFTPFLEFIKQIPS